MRWGRNNSRPSSSPTSIIARVFPVSWLSKSRPEQRGGDKIKRTSDHQVDIPITPISSRWKEERFYSMDEDDAYWRLSFSEERITRARRSTGGINPLWYDDYDHHHHHHHHHHRFRVPHSSFESQECRNFNEMVSDIKKMREKQKASRRSPAHRVSNSAETDIFPVKLKEINVKRPESPSKSANISNRECRIRHRAKAYSPRTECKIRALEEIKKARTKAKKKMKERKEQVAVDEEEEEKTKTVFDSFAVVKSSFDPQQDFRDSMVEMIREQGISRPKDLEELLACYLTLNCDEYHDLIIKVFRKVWFEMNGVDIHPQVQALYNQ